MDKVLLLLLTALMSVLLVFDFDLCALCPIYVFGIYVKIPLHFIDLSRLEVT
jgi:hypothetical protein